MISDLDIDRIATSVVRKMEEAELDRLLEDLNLELQLESYEAERRRLLLEQATRKRRLGVLKIVTILILAFIYILMFEAL